MTSVLANAAFGDDPGRWPLPPAGTAHDMWLRAVAAGGQGRYSWAVAELTALRRSHPDGRLASLAHTTHASFLRQLGWHARARGCDGRGAALAGSDAEAGADALIGLAADALGVGRFALSQRLLQRAAELTSDAPPRLPVRLAWVSAELAMARGEPVAALRHGEHAVALAGDLGSTRHTVKSAVVHAAALCSAGEVDECRRVADAALQTARKAGLSPLTWALSCLLADVGSTAHSADEIYTVRNDSADRVYRRGGVWSDR